ncbi:isochorismatase family protein [Micrococcales bacterium 31B]|nr:isochorismatase family protein [Micrococcales bacterium 31B]
MAILPSSTALVVVDAQYDFAEGGTLAVPGALAAYARIARHIDATRYDVLVTTQDWHIDPGTHWSDQPDFEDSWPVHCAAETRGAEVHDEIAAAVDRYTARGRRAHRIIKGEYAAAYSGAEGHEVGGDRGLCEILDASLVRRVDVCGVATDYCVAATARDLRDHGYAVRVLPNLVAAINAEEGQRVLAAYGGAERP